MSEEMFLELLFCKDRFYYVKKSVFCTHNVGALFMAFAIQIYNFAQSGKGKISSKAS